MRAPSRDRWTWAAAALALSATIAAAATLSDPSLATATGTLTADARDGPPVAASDSLATDLPPDREAAFRHRLRLFAPVEAGLRRAFFGEPSAPVARRRPATARVRPAGDDRGCLSQAIYYEARGEPAEGQAAVAQVVLNRARSGSHPASLCGVVFEGATRAGCQFSFACDPRLAGRRLDGGAWRRAQAAAAVALAAPGRPELRDALNYHADHVRPGWAQRLRRAAEIGRHIFYGSAAPTPPNLAE